MAKDKTHEHRPGVYSEGGRRTIRCQSCFEELEEVEGAQAAAPQPEPVDVSKPEGEGGRGR